MHEKSANLKCHRWPLVDRMERLEMTFKTLLPRAMEVAYLDIAEERLRAPSCSEGFFAVMQE